MCPSGHIHLLDRRFICSSTGRSNGRWEARSQSETLSFTRRWGAQSIGRFLDSPLAVRVVNGDRFLDWRLDRVRMSVSGETFVRWIRLGLLSDYEDLTKVLRRRKWRGQVPGSKPCALNFDANG